MSPPSHNSLPSLIHKIPQKPYICEGSPAQAGLGFSTGKLAYQSKARPRAKAQRAPLSLRAQVQASSAEGCLRLPLLCVCVCARLGGSRIRPAINAVCRRQALAASGWDTNPLPPTFQGRKEQGNGVGELGSCLLSIGSV